VGVDIYTVFLTLELARGEWSASRPGRFTPREMVLGTHWIGGWVNPRVGLDDVENRKFLTLPGLANSNPSVVQPVTSLYTDYAIPFPTIKSKPKIKRINITCNFNDKNNPLVLQDVQRFSVCTVTADICKYNYFL
jgi:hypothetical protein